MAKRAEPASPGTPGRLELAAIVDGERVEGSDDYRYVGQLRNGMLAFVPGHEVHPIYLEPAEVVRFLSSPGASACRPS